MEFLNKVEIKGIVGNVVITDCTTDLKCASFSAVTEHYDKAHNTIEITWWNCLAWTNQCPNCTEIKKGDHIHVIGRLRTKRVIDAQGRDKPVMEIIAQNIEFVE